MQTEIGDFSHIARGARLLQAGELVAFPTETVYGLGAPLFCEEAVRRVFAVKGRPKDNPLIVHISAMEQLQKIIPELPPQFFLLAERFWPGPLTLVVKQEGIIPSIVSAGHPTVALRMPRHPVALALIEAVGEPLVAPSANLSGRPSPTSARDVLEDLEGKIALILDGGECAIGIESTVVSLVEKSPLLLRPGAISKQEIENLLKTPLLLPDSQTPLHSPGMRYRHYAPKAKVRLCFQPEEIQNPFVLSLTPKKGERLLSAKSLYAAFREADRLQIPEIAIDCSPALQADEALFNRVLRASSSERA